MEKVLRRRNVGAHSPRLNDTIGRDHAIVRYAMVRMRQSRMRMQQVNTKLHISGMVIYKSDKRQHIIVLF